MPRFRTAAIAICLFGLISWSSASRAAVPVISSGTVASGRVGSAFNFIISASNSPTSYSAVGLPAGMTIDTNLGVISGTPTAVGTSMITLGATNSSGTGSSTLLFTVISDLAKGADVGWLQQMAASNFTFYDSNGQMLDSDPTTNCLKILRERNIDTIRLRVFVPPITAANWDNQLAGNCTAPEIAVVAAKAQALGFRILIDLHYSWTFADPGNQRIPVNWAAEIASMSTANAVTDLASEITAHTTDVLTQLKTAGVTPEWLQVGNEITNGMLSEVQDDPAQAATSEPFGSTSYWPSLVTFINAGYNAVKAVDPNIKVVVHIDRAHSDSIDKGFFTTLKNDGGKWDVSGTDFSGGTYSDTSFTMDDLAASFNTPGQGGAGVMMCEIEPADIYSGTTYNPNPAFDTVTNIVNLMRAVPGNKGLAAIYWEPEADPDWRGYLQSAWTNEEPSSALDSMKPSILQATGLNIVNATGQTVSLKGTNLGGDMVMEPAITPADKSGLPDEYSIVSNLDTRFGVPTEQSLITTYRNSWIAAADFDNIKGQGMNVIRVPVWWGDFYPLAALNTQAVAITSPTSATGTLGSAFTYAIGATNSPTSFTASPLPAGINFNSSTGVLSGTPTTAGKTTITLQATGSGGTGTEILTVTINTPTAGSSVVTNGTTSLSVSSTSPTVSYQITGTNTPTSFSTSTLPGGLSLSTTGLISGTLSPSTPGVYDLTITATNATGSNSTNLSLTVTGSVASNAAPVLRSDAFTVLDSIVATAAERGIYTIIDMHGAFGGQSMSENTGYAGQNQFWTNANDQTNTQLMWSAIAAHYNGNAWVAGYDLLNEPTGAPSNQAVVTQLSSLYTAVRAADPYHIIFMEGTGGSTGWEQLPNPSSVGWTNVVYEMHEYERTNPTASSVKAGADSQVADFTNNKSYNVPAYIGEFNALGTGNPVWQYMVSDFNNAGMNWSAWTYKTTDTSTTDGAGIYKPTGTLPAIPNIPTDASSTISSDWTNWTTAKAFALDPVTSTALIGPATITSLTQGKFASSSPFSYTITASDVPTSFSASGLPSGLTLNPTTGVISGTPTTIGTTTVYNVALSATTSGGTTTGTLRLKLTPPVPVITSKTTDTATTGVAYSYTIAGTNGPNNFTTSTLPAGLTLNSNSGLISGTPTATGTTNITLGASNSYGTGNATLVLTVNPPAVKPVINSATTVVATTGVGFIYTITATNNPTTFNATGLPSGLTVVTTTGVISGTPTAIGSFSVALSAGNAAGTATATLSLTVNAASTTPLTWTGSASKVWDTSTANWTNGSAAATYADTDPVTFDDTGSGGTITWTGIFSPSSVTVNSSTQSYSFSGGILGGSMTLTKNGTSTLGLSTANTYTGGTLFLEGGLSLSGNSSALGTGALTLGSAGDTNTLVVRANSINLANQIVVNTGGARWLEPGNGAAVTYTGAVVLNGGATLGFSTVGGNVSASGGVTGTGNILLGENGGSRGNSETLSGGAINNTGTISDSGNPDTGGAFISAAIGTNVTGIVQGSSSEAMTLSGVNSFNGPITITAGTLSVGGAGVLGSGTFTGTISNTGTLLYNSSASQTFGGTISGTGALVDSGAGTLTLSGSNSYMGATTVNAGALNVMGSISSSAVSVASGATLSGTGTTGAVTVSNGGNINLQDGKIGTLTVGGLTIGNATLPSVISLDIQTAAGATTVDNIVDTGSLALNGNQGTTIAIGNLNGTTTLFTGKNIYTLLTYTGAQQSLGNIVLSSTSLDGKVLSLSQSGDTIYLNVLTPATVTLGNLATQYNGSPQSATAITNPSGLAVTFTYNGNSTAPTAIGSYAVVGTINDPNYAGSGTGTLVVSQGTAGVTLGNLAATYNGSPQAATATTSPPGLNTSITYNGSSTAPSAVGSYTVNVTVNDPNYQGSATGTLVISQPMSVASDSPTMPQWGLILLAGLLVYYATRDPKLFAARLVVGAAKSRDGRS
jgi:autotransporter-associated beta strand protein